MKLYHFLPQENLAFVKKTCTLFSAAEMLDACEWSHLKKKKRKRCLTLPNGVILRDQQKLEEENIEFSLGFEMKDLVALLNEHVFFWPCFPRPRHNDSKRSFADKYKNDALICCNLTDIQINPSNPVLYCPFNSGAPKRVNKKKVLHSPCMYQPLDIRRVSTEAIVEVVFCGSVQLPTNYDYMMPDQWQKEYL